MASVFAPNVVQANLNFTYQDEPAQNTLYFLAPTEPDLSALRNLAQQLYAYWASTAAPFVPSVVRLDSVEAISLDNPFAPIFEYFPEVVATGEELTDAASNNVTIAISFRTGLRGKAFRGRNYWVGLLEANITNNRVASAVLDSIQSYYEGIIGSNSNVEGWLWGVYSRYFQGEPRLTGLFTPIVSVGFANNVVDSQRGRLPQ